MPTAGSKRRPKILTRIKHIVAVHILLEVEIGTTDVAPVGQIGDLEKNGQRPAPHIERSAYSRIQRCERRIAL